MNDVLEFPQVNRNFSRSPSNGLKMKTNTEQKEKSIRLHQAEDLSFNIYGYFIYSINIGIFTFRFRCFCHFSFVSFDKFSFVLSPKTYTILCNENWKNFVVFVSIVFGTLQKSFQILAAMIMGKTKQI